jgi:prefoldin subunit 5
LQVKRKVVEATTDEKIAMLEERKAYLVSQKSVEEKKLARLRERMAEKEGQVSVADARRNGG